MATLVESLPCSLSFRSQRDLDSRGRRFGKRGVVAEGALDLNRSCGRGCKFVPEVSSHGHTHLDRVSGDGAIIITGIAREESLELASALVRESDHLIFLRTKAKPRFFPSLFARFGEHGREYSRNDVS